MKAIKIYLIVVTVLLIVALSVGVYVWYLVQNFKQQAVADVHTVRNEDRSAEQLPEADSGVSGAGTSEEKPVVIDTTKLSPSQQKAFETFGYTEEKVTVPTALIACAKNAVGQDRFDAIVGGSTPTPSESITLLPCMKLR